MHLQSQPVRRRHELSVHHPHPAVPHRNLHTHRTAPHLRGQPPRTQPQRQHTPRPQRRRQPGARQYLRPRHPTLVERADTHPVPRLQPLQLRQQRNKSRFRLHVQIPPRPRKRLQQLPEQRHRLPTSDSRPPHLLPGQVRDPAAAIGHPVQRGVVERHQPPVSRTTVAAGYAALRTGAMGAVSAICGLLAARGERIAVEHPSYANILQLMREAGARLVPVPMAADHTGWDLPAWQRTLRAAAPQLAYVMADFHNPTGALADTGQRRELVTAARTAGTLLVVDETMVDLALDEPTATAMPSPVAAFDPAGSSVITLGSASKAVWAGMRLGWVRAAPDLIRRLAVARGSADLGSPVLEQLALTHLLRSGEWHQAVDVCRTRARSHRDALVTAVREQLPQWEFTVPHGGLTLWARTGGLSGSRIAEVGERLGVRVPSGPRFGVDGAFEGYVRLPFTVSGAQAVEAASRLAAASRLVAGGGTATTATPPGLVV
ncbi:PLP-dependent aminotransferase family protein [Streptomyces sp. P38-E01]|uniref:PLP-dependent aminotransferase family protein n=1 Tax=Streptomyces tardus TaxID=2780544 RepID=A0A949N6H6_9ACTN|nr:PLP-dependent aminotransferase family protein [Streptomyces tardus]